MTEDNETEVDETTQLEGQIKIMQQVIDQQRDIINELCENLGKAEAEAEKAKSEAADARQQGISNRQQLWNAQALLRRGTPSREQYEEMAEETSKLRSKLGHCEHAVDENYQLCEMIKSLRSEVTELQNRLSSKTSLLETTTANLMSTERRLREMEVRQAEPPELTGRAGHVY